MNKIILENDNVILTDGTKVSISKVVEYYILENHSKKETANYFNLSYQQLTGVIIKGNIIKDNKLSRKLNNKTLLQKYGDPHYNNIQKCRKTCLERYGVDNIFKDKDRIKKSYIHKLGVDNPNKLSEVREKIKNTNLERYGTACGYNVYDSKTGMIKRELTCQEKYGGNSPMCSEEVKAKYDFKKISEKVFLTKLKNGTTNTSKPQKYLLNELKCLFGQDDVIAEYNKDLRYPFHCDVYIKSMDTFIELNLYFTHGRHPFNKNDVNDIQILEKWIKKSAKSDFYKNAINVWTRLDPLKQEIAAKNNLNYIMLYSEKALYEFIHNLKEKYKNED